MDPYESHPDLAKTLRAVDMYTGLRFRVRRTHGAQAVTNAWLKMYEIISQLGLFETALLAPGTLRAFCNAELPGAFISALNHYACTWSPETKFEWVASSLYPSGERAAGAHPSEALGDHYGLYAHNQSRWLMDADMRGDLTRADDIRELARRAKEKLGEIDLYTSDVGIDVSDDYTRQEARTAHLNFGQILLGLLTLRIGGVFVVKTYTFTQPFSLSIIGICAASFDTLLVTKPQASRPTNSETYLVGFGFRGLQPAAESALFQSFESFDFGRPLFPLGLPEVEHTIQSLLVAARQIHLRQQVNFLKEMVAFFHHRRQHPTDGRQLEALSKVARGVQNRWLQNNPVRPLQPQCRLDSAESL
jgi:hypothetical protein